MNNIKRVIFVAGAGTSRAPMAAAVFNSSAKNINVEAEARGLVVNFPEPLNQKAEAVLISNGIELKDFSSKQLTNSDFEEGNLIVTMEEKQRQRILLEYPDATEENTQTLSVMVGDELEVMDPYGSPIQTYGLCFEVIKVSVEKLIRILEES